MKWVFLTRIDGVRVWVNIERFDMAYDSVDEDGNPCTALVMIIGEDEFCEVHVKEKPEDILYVLEGKNK
jgi:hypothetical protein